MVGYLLVFVGGRGAICGRFPGQGDGGWMRWEAKWECWGVEAGGCKWWKGGGKESRGRRRCGFLLVGAPSWSSRAHSGGFRWTPAGYLTGFQLGCREFSLGTRGFQWTSAGILVDFSVCGGSPSAPLCRTRTARRGRGSARQPRKKPRIQSDTANHGLQTVKQRTLPPPGDWAGAH